MAAAATTSIRKVQTERDLARGDESLLRRPLVELELAIAYVAAGQDDRAVALGELVAQRHVAEPEGVRDGRPVRRGQVVELVLLLVVPGCRRVGEEPARHEEAQARAETPRDEPVRAQAELIHE